MSPVRPIGNLDLLSEQTESRADFITLRNTFPYRPTLFLGLGGTGSQAVSKMKSLLVKTFSEASKEQEARIEDIPSCFAFRAFDTNPGERPTNLAAGAEWFDMQVENVEDVLVGARNHSYYRGWLPEKLSVNAITNGCGGQRMLGRLALGANVAKYHAAVTSALRQITQASPNLVEVTPKVYVFCSLSGGTGSGMVFDAAFHIRKNAPPNTQIIGMLAYLEGLPSMAASAKVRALAGTYSALRELNSFMDDREREIGVKFGSTFNFPTDGIEGQWGRPFNYPFLVSEKDARGSLTLPKQDHVSSFLARLAFCMTSTYCPRYVKEHGLEGATLDFWGAFRNVADELEPRRSGVPYRFIVPALAQVHFPIEDTADMLCLQSAIRVLKHLSGGRAYPGDKDAADFLANPGDNQSYEGAALVDASSRTVTGETVARKKYDFLSDTLRKPDRYAQKQSILAHGEAMLEKRLGDLCGAMDEQRNRLQDNACRLLDQKVRQLLMDDAFLYCGTLDFLDDLEARIDAEIAALAALEADDIAAPYAAIAKRWAEIRPLVLNVVTDDGLIDRTFDKLVRVDKATELYINFLNQTESTVYRKAQFESARSVLSALKKRAESSEASLRSLYVNVIADAQTALRGRLTSIAERLLREEQGSGNSPETVRSYAVLTEEWRSQLLEGQPDLAPGSLLNAIRRDGWTPVAWLEQKPAEGSTQPPHLLVAQDLVARINPLVARIRAMDVGTALTQVKDMRGRQPAEAVGDIILGMGLMQAPVGAHARLPNGALPQQMAFLSGLSDSMMDEVRRTGGGRALQDLVRIESYELRRVTYFTVGVPASIAGLSNVRTVYEPAYEQWRESLETTARGREEKEIMRTQRAMLHAYAGSENWHSPTQYGDHKPVETFAKALALSEILRFEDFPAPEGREDDKTAMSAVAKAPKDKGYSLFRFGRANFWIMPFFTPGRAESDLEGGPTNVGTNLWEASMRVRDDAAVAECAEGWVAWFDANWQSFLTQIQVKERLEQAIGTLRKAYVTDRDERVVATWEQMHPVLKDWSAKLD